MDLLRNWVNHNLILFIVSPKALICKPAKIRMGKIVKNCIYSKKLMKNSTFSAKIKNRYYLSKERRDEYIFHG